VSSGRSDVLQAVQRLTLRPPDCLWLMNTSTEPDTAAWLIGTDGRRFALNHERPTRIGRSADNDIVVSDRSVSRHHATISQENGRYVVRDLQSQNGTFVSGRKMSAGQFADGDRIRFGDTELTLSSPGARTVDSAAVDVPSTVTAEPPARASWWRSRGVQAGAVVTMATVVALTFALRQPPAEKGEQALGLTSLASGQTNFNLPNASPDFVGDWYGALPATLRSPPTFGQESNICGATFYLADKQVVMSIASYAAANLKVTAMKATGIDPNHITVDEEILVGDTTGQTWRDHQKVELVLVSPERLDCTITDNYSRGSVPETTGRVVYQGALRRISRTEADRQIEEMKKRGLNEKARVEAPISKE
jgi:pSer/pThr/pTyr-binding forkhead associated (FHA) protein